jgi:UDP-N-acetylmuramoylalanine-D-glutamate ligase
MTKRGNTHFPAFPGFDMFRNFVERGRRFKALVREPKARG